MTKLHSEGKCFFCGETFAKAGISRHLNTHLKNMTGKTKGQSYHLRVEASEMFLNLWVDGRATFEDIDDFLRQIWLECCGHMSCFVDPQKRNASRGFPNFDFFADMDDEFEQPGEIKKNENISKVLHDGMLLKYEYDFGSTTMLNIKVMGVFSFAADKKIVLLSRNEPLEIVCTSCKKEPAVEICTVCIGYEEGFFCKKCAKIHEKECGDFADYAKAPVVNSPRMGVCAYEGGDIDKQRDGVFKKKV